MGGREGGRGKREGKEGREGRGRGEEGREGGSSLYIFVSILADFCADR